jgi:hypothetical protein
MATRARAQALTSPGDIDAEVENESKKTYELDARSDFETPHPTDRLDQTVIRAS